jgi:hypothetical protein
MSDFEVNKRVAELYLNAIKAFKANDRDESVTVIGRATYSNFDPCNNPSDAWPIIVENRIAINPYDDVSQGWFATTDTSFFVDDKNPLRAAMICYLILVDKKKQ